MIKEYRSRYPNHVHQLSISVSKHYYAGRDGRLKYQKKAFEVSLNDTEAMSKEHLLIYALRDHCTGLFYVELAFATSSLLSASAFLGRAWRPKSEIVFQGIPEVMTIPNTVEDAFPGLSCDVELLGINLVPVTNGFQSGGIGVVKAVESGLLFYIDEQVSCICDAATEICQINANRRARNNSGTKQNMWEQHVGCIRMPLDGFGV